MLTSTMCVCVGGGRGAGRAGPKGGQDGAGSMEEWKGSPDIHDFSWKGCGGRGVYLAPGTRGAGAVVCNLFESMH